MYICICMYIYSYIHTREYFQVQELSQSLFHKMIIINRGVFNSPLGINNNQLEPRQAIALIMGNIIVHF